MKVRKSWYTSIEYTKGGNAETNSSVYFFFFFNFAERRDETIQSHLM